MSNPAIRALVTGGSGGIGAAICRRLAAAGHFVYVHAHRGTAAAEALGARASLLRAARRSRSAFDVTDAEATQAAIDGDAGDRADTNPGEQCRPAR